MLMSREDISCPSVVLSSADSSTYMQNHNDTMIKDA